MRQQRCWAYHAAYGRWRHWGYYRIEAVRPSLARSLRSRVHICQFGAELGLGFPDGQEGAPGGRGPSGRVSRAWASDLSFAAAPPFPLSQLPPHQPASSPSALPSASIGDSPSQRASFNGPAFRGRIHWLPLAASGQGTQTAVAALAIHVGGADVRQRGLPGIAVYTVRG